MNQPDTQQPAMSNDPAPVDSIDLAPSAPAVRTHETPVVAGMSTRFEEVITGQFDADEDDVALEPPKRVLAPQPETPKLHKVLAQAGLGSRLEMEQLILEGRISVNGEPAHIGQRIQHDGRCAPVLDAPIAQKAVDADR